MFCLSSLCWQIVHRGPVMQKFHDVTVEIEAALTQIPYDHFEVSEEVIEQVLLSAFVFFFLSFGFGHNGLQILMILSL